MGLDLARWFQKPERREAHLQEEALGAAVRDLVEARMNMLRATLQTRAAYLKAQGLSCDSAALRTEITARVEELEFVLGQMGG